MSTSEMAWLTWKSFHPFSSVRPAALRISSAFVFVVKHMGFAVDDDVSAMSGISDSRML